MAWRPLTAILMLVLASACGNASVQSETNGSHGSSSGGHAGAAAGTTGTSGSIGRYSSGTGSSSGSTHGAVTTLAISPNPGTLTVVNNTGSLAFTATATYADGTSAKVTPTWTFDRMDLAWINGMGILVANGTLSGSGNVTATYSGVSASAPVTIDLTFLQNDAGLTPAQVAAFNSPTTTPSGTLLYPYDATVFPQGLLAPELMWSGGAAGDLYRIQLTETACQATLYATADPPSAAPIPQGIWDALTTSNQGETLALDIERLSGGVVYASMHEGWTIAPGSLRGSIYYWAVSEGQLMKIKPGASSPTPVFDPGPADQLDTPAPANYDGTTPPWTAPSGSSDRCVACHTVSKDGSTAVAVFERQSNASSPWGTLDLTATAPDVTQISSYTDSVDFLGLTPDGTYAVENDSNFTIHLDVAHSGAAVPSALDAITGAADPSFAPNGQLLAFASSVVGSYPVEYTNANLDVIQFGADAGFFGDTTIAVSDGGAVAFPSFSPDSAWVFYQYGDYSRAKYGTSSVGHDDLFLTDLAGQVGPQELAAASGAALDARDQHLSYQPTVNPISVGGYSWVVFVSPRDYGNQMLSVSDPTYENHKQLWVAAVDASPTPGTDPSHPAFWLPGQDPTTVNMSGYWALDACQSTGSTCEQGFECCTGHCAFESSGGSCVSAPPDGGCSPTGDACTTTADCCGTNVSCVGGYCATMFK